MIGLQANGECILLVNVDNHIYAYADCCPHQKSRLSDGTLTDKVIRCATHHWQFDACTGRGVNPQNTCLRAFPIKVDGQDILIDIDSATCLRAAVGEGN